MSERDVRIAKVQQLRDLGVNPYVEKYPKAQTIHQVITFAETKSSLRDSEVIVPSPIVEVTTAGRVLLARTHGALTFVRLQDQTGIIQIMLHKDNCMLRLETNTEKKEIGDMSAYKFFEKYIDVGDFIGVTGEVFKTHKGELTIFAPEFTLLTKAILPLGDKFHGIEDDDLRLRKRYLDTTLNAESRDMLIRRSKFRQAMRSFLLQYDFMEVETPVLEVTTGGADANPFKTHHEALDIDVFLRISCGELRQKRLMV